MREELLSVAAIHGNGTVPILCVGATATIGNGSLGSDAAVLQEVEAEGEDGIFWWERLHGG